MHILFLLQVLWLLQQVRVVWQQLNVRGVSLHHKVVSVGFKNSFVFELEATPVVAVQLAAQILLFERLTSDPFSLRIVCNREHSARRVSLVLLLLLFFDMQQLLQLFFGFDFVFGLLIFLRVGFLCLESCFKLFVIHCLGDAITDVAVLPILLQDPLMTDVLRLLVDVGVGRSRPDELMFGSELKSIRWVGFVGVRCVPFVTWR